MRKKIFKILLMVLLSSIPFKQTYAYDIPFAETSDGTSNYGNPGSTPTSATANIDCRGCGDGYRSKISNPDGTPPGMCIYNYNMNKDTTISVYVTDMGNEEAIKGSIFMDKVFSAGTWVGVKNEEKRHASWSISGYQYIEKKYEYTCIKSNTTYGDYSKNECIYHGFWDPIDNQCIVTKTTHHTELNHTAQYGSCDEGTRTASHEYYVPNPAYNGNCVNAIGSKLATSACNYINTQSSEVEYINTNDYKKYEEYKKKPNDFIGQQIIKTANSSGPTVNCKGGASGSYDRIVTYSPSKTCINMISGNVTYDRNCNNDTEVEVTKTANGYWRYFIPLNINSGKEFFINVKKSASSNMTAKECQYVIDHNPIKKYYIDEMVPMEIGEIFTGKPALDLKTIRSEIGDFGCRDIKTGEAVKKDWCIDQIQKYNPKTSSYLDFIVKPGGEHFTGNYENDSAYVATNKCELATTINFDIEQQFYGESKNSLRGYGMYFRQIDINKPFPNGLSNDSYWNQSVYNETEKKVNGTTVLSTSFNSPTYVANMTKANVGIVRAFNKKNPYTRWIGDTEDSQKVDGMYANGESVFIQNNSRIFTTKSNKFYELGCGPATQWMVRCQ